MTDARDLDARIEELVGATRAGGPRTGPGGPAGAPDGGDASLLAVAAALLDLPAAAWPELDGVAGAFGRIARRRASRRRSRARWLARGGVALATAAVVAAAVLVGTDTFGPAAPASAEALARRALDAGSAGALPAVHLEEVVVNSLQAVPEPLPPRVVDRLDYAAPDRWRESVMTVLPHGEGTASTVTVRDGGTVTTETGGRVTARPVGGGRSAGSPVLAARSEVLDELRQVGTTTPCAPAARVEVGGPALLGRSTEVLHLGPSPCPSASAPETDGPADIVVDRQTSLVLAAVLRGPDGKVAQKVTVTGLVLRPSFPPGTFRPPADGEAVTGGQGATGGQGTTDGQDRAGSGAVPAGSDHPATLAALAAQSAFPPLGPTDTAGLHLGDVSVVSRDRAGRAAAFTLTYLDGHGQAQLQIYEAPAASPSVRYPGQQVRLASGSTGTYDAPGDGFQVVWFVTGDCYISVTAGGRPSPGVTLGHAVDRATLLAIAGSIRG